MDKEPQEFCDVFTDVEKVQARARVIGILASSKWHESSAIAMQACGNCAAALRLGPLACEAVYRNQCRQRLCPVCATLKAGRTRARLQRVVDERVQAGRRFSMMSLTFAHRAGDRLHELIKVLFKALALFRKTAFFERNIRGWARSIEVTWDVANGFHPHAHFIIEAGFMSIEKLHKAWAKCCAKAGGRTVEFQGVDLFEPNEGTGLNEAIGYSFKVLGLSTWPEDKILELAEAVKGKHLYQACRNWSRRGKELEQQANDLADLESESKVVRFADFLEEVRQGQSEACTYVHSVAALLSATAGLESLAPLVVTVAPQHWRNEWMPPESAA